MLSRASLVVLGISIYKAIRFISRSHDNVINPDAVDDSCKDDVVPPGTKYDVFLSFRGEDTRDNFSSFLYDALCKANIQTFMDHKLHKGDQISPILLKTIKESEISVIIFSKDYASSTWCMDELVHILECKVKYGRVVIPIFYHVDPSDIRKQNGSFGKGFAKLKQRFKHNQDRVQKWRDALMEATGLCGWDSQNFRPESKLIETIVKDILSKLNHKSSCRFDEGLVGFDHHMENIEKLLSMARIVGIWGMGGAGKTTLAKAIFHKLKAQFEAFSFVENVREKLARNGLDKLQAECLKELLKDKEIDIYNIKSTFVKRRLQLKKILLILDDVDNSIIIEDLTKVCDWFGKGSRIIITSRDKQVLNNASASTTYHVPILDSHHAFCLFSLKAFKQKEPSKSYMELSKSVVNYCQGNPLALVVLGCSLRGKGKEEWESALEKLNQTPPKDIVDVLKLSFDGLDDNQQNVFLDIAFLMREIGSISLNLIRHFYDTSVQIEISVLEDRSLISIDRFCGDIKMHDLVRKMGLKNAKSLLPLGHGNQVRLWSHEDIDSFFINNKEIEAIQCLSLDMSKIRRTQLTAGDFARMYKLKFLKVYRSDRKKPPKVNICENLDYLSEELRFLFWEEYHLPSVPLSFCADNLVHLEMRDSHLQQLWNGDQRFPNLKIINLDNSKCLLGLPDLYLAPNIEEISLDNCVNLGEIHSSTILGKLKFFTVDLCKEPRHVNIGGTIKGGCSGFVRIFKFLDLRNFSFHKVTMKLFVSDDGNIICGIQFKHEWVPFKQRSKSRNNIEGANFKLGTQSLVSLLPFIREVYWYDDPIGFGNFNQHFYYSYHPDDFGLNDYFIVGKRVIKEERVESGVVGGLKREGVHVDDDKEEEELMGEVLECCSSNSDEYDDYREEEELTRQVVECCCSSNSDSNKLTRAVPNIITRWSLLTKLSLKSDMMMMIGDGGGSIPQVSALKSVAHSNLQTLAHVTLSLDHLLGICPDREFYISYSDQEEGDEYGHFFYHALLINPSSVGFYFW